MTGYHKSSMTEWKMALEKTISSVAFCVVLHMQKGKIPEWCFIHELQVLNRPFILHCFISLSLLSSLHMQMRCFADFV